MPRKCKDWLKTFMQWTLPRSEAHESLILWTGLFTLASTLRRRVSVTREYLGSWSCPPHLYVMFIAPPGEARKTTTMSYAIDLLDEIPGITRGPTIVTQAALLTKLLESPDSSVYLTAEEFSDLIMKSRGEMFEFLTSMFDGKKSIEATTIHRGAEFIEKPCINMLAATTPLWVAENMSEAVIGGGFASRVVFLYEDSIRRKQLFYHGTIDFSHLDKLRSDLIEDLIHISQLQGDFEIQKDAVKHLEAWYQARESAKNKKLKGYHERKPAHLLKVAMLHRIATSDELSLSMDNFKYAQDILDQVEKKLPKVFEGIGKNPYTFDMKDILAFIKDSGKIERAELLQHFNAVAQPGILLELINALSDMKLIKVEVNGTKTIYTAR